MGFDLVAIDPPWAFNSNSLANPGRNARRHYPTLQVAEIAKLPVAQLLSENSMVPLWITGPLLAVGAHLELFEAWGLVPSSLLFVWIKLKKGRKIETFTQRDLFMGGGLTTRKNAEFVILGRRGRSLRAEANILDVIIEPVREHSRKPEEFYRRCERYAGPTARRIDIFARQSRPGWTTWGLEKTMFDQKETEIGKTKGIEEQSKKRVRAEAKGGAGGSVVNGFDG